jgi:hypothetical protein
MESHTKICQHKGAEHIIDEFIYLLMLFVELVKTSSFYFSQPKHFLCNLNVDNPMNERNKVTWIQSMPQGTYQYCVKLPHSLTFFFFFFVSKVLGVVHVLINIAAQSPLYTHVPVISFDFHTGIHVKFPHTINLYLGEVILYDSSVLFLDVL